MVVVAIAMGLVCGFDAVKVINTVKSGFGNILANIGIVILCGTIIGTILEKTGAAALTMANSILGVVGKERSVLTMGAMGYVTGIPGLLRLGLRRPLADKPRARRAEQQVARRHGDGALRRTLRDPLPSSRRPRDPIAMAGTLGADLGLTIIVGLILSVPGVAVAVLYASKISSKVEIPANSQYTMEELVEKYGKLPGVLHSFSPIFLPIILIGIASVVSFPSRPLGEGFAFKFLNFIGNPRRRAHARRIPRYDAHS